MSRDRRPVCGSGIWSYLTDFSCSKFLTVSAIAIRFSLCQPGSIFGAVAGLVYKLLQGSTTYRSQSDLIPVTVSGPASSACPRSRVQFPVSVTGRRDDCSSLRSLEANMSPAPSYSLAQARISHQAATAIARCACHCSCSASPSGKPSADASRSRCTCSDGWSGSMTRHDAR